MYLIIIIFKYYYNQNNINYLSENNNLCNKIVDLKQLERDNPNFNQMSQLKISHYYNNDTIENTIVFVKNEGNNKKVYSCNYKNSIKLEKGGIISEHNSFLNNIKNIIESHSKKDEEFHTYSLERNTILQLLYNLKDKYKKDSEKIKNIQSWINEIENIEKKIK